jgi:hypothetical protein
MEAVVKQADLRAKGTELFWPEAGAEAILRLRVDPSSDGQPPQAFRQRWHAAATGQRPYEWLGGKKDLRRDFIGFRRQGGFEMW